MKGLLLKELYMIGKYFRSFLFIILVFLLSSIWAGNNLFLLVYPMIVVTMLPMSTLSYDEKFGWDVYCGALPCSRAQVVSVKYLLCLLSIGLIALLSLAAQLARVGIGGGRLDEIAPLFSVILAVGLAGPSLLLPIVFKLGVEKGRIAYYIVIGAMCGAVVLFTTADVSAPFSVSLPVTLLPLAVLALFAASWLLSVCFYQKRSL